MRTVEFKCPVCQRIVLVPPGTLYYRKYCGRECARKVIKPPVMKGPNNPRWRGGKALYYGPGWKEIKELVRARDRICQNCGKTPEENGRALDVHHIGPYRFTGDNDFRNLVALCRSCHMRSIDHGRRGSAKFAGPKQLELKPLSQREMQRQRGQAIREKRRELQEKAKVLHAKGRSLRQIGRALGVSHQTVANWLS